MGVSVCAYVHVCLCGGVVRVTCILFLLQLEEVYKSALGCFVNGSEKLVSAAEHGDHADQYLRKARVHSMHNCV